MAKDTYHSHRALEHQRGLWLRRPETMSSSPIGEKQVKGIPNQDSLETLFPPIADYAFLSDCENTLPDRTDRRRRVDVHS